MSALFTKRFHIYKRDKTGLCCEVLTPLILVIFGCALLQIPFLFPTPPFEVTTSAYPAPQRALFNIDPVVTTTNQYVVDDFIQTLPNLKTFWDIDQIPDSPGDKTFLPFYNATYAERTIGDAQPYRFSSYQLY